VALALVHIEGVQYYVASPWKRMLWRVFALSWIAVVCYVRLLRPWQLARRPYRVSDIAHERGDAWTLALEPRGHTGFSFQPGQFAWLTLGGSPFMMKEHPFSFSSSPLLPGGRVELTIKELGDFTRTIGRVPRDAVAFVDGPYGAFTIDRHPAPGYVFVAGGIGIAPIVSMLRSLADRGDPRPLLLFYAYRRWERVTFREVVEDLRSRLNLTVVFVLEEPPEQWTGERGWITREVLERHLPEGRALHHAFVCGPEAMTQAIERHLQSLGVPMSHVHSELFELV
jgi:predicted ferric reductase